MDNIKHVIAITCASFSTYCRCTCSFMISFSTKNHAPSSPPAAACHKVRRHFAFMFLMNVPCCAVFWLFYFNAGLWILLPFTRWTWSIRLECSGVLRRPSVNREKCLLTLSCMYVCPYVSVLRSLGGFPWNLILETFTKIYPEKSKFD
jgi:hypothetical protein